MATITFNGHVQQDSAVAQLTVDETNGHETDSILVIVMWKYSPARPGYRVRDRFTKWRPRIYVGRVA